MGYTSRACDRGRCCFGGCRRVFCEARCRGDGDGADDDDDDEGIALVTASPPPLPPPPRPCDERGLALAVGAVGEEEAASAIEAAAVAVMEKTPRGMVSAAEAPPLFSSCTFGMLTRAFLFDGDIAYCLLFLVLVF